MSRDQKPERQNTNVPQVNNSPAPGRSMADAGPRGCPTKRMLKNNEPSRNLYENKGNTDKMPGEMSGIYVDLTHILAKIPPL
jgi:hypothetical protein